MVTFEDYLEMELTARHPDIPPHLLDIVRARCTALRETMTTHPAFAETSVLQNFWVSGLLCEACRALLEDLTLQLRDKLET